MGSSGTQIQDMQEPGTAPAWHPEDKKEKTPSALRAPPPEARGRREIEGSCKRFRYLHGTRQRPDCA
jgi:hypothetical protein